MFVTVSANDQLHSKQHRGLFFFFLRHTEKTNFTTTYCHTCKRAREHNVTFTSNEIERIMGWGVCGRAKTVSPLLGL